MHNGQRATKAMVQHTVHHSHPAKLALLSVKLHSITSKTLIIIRNTSGETI